MKADRRIRSDYGILLQNGFELKAKKYFQIIKSRAYFSGASEQSN